MSGSSSVTAMKTMVQHFQRETRFNGMKVSQTVADLKQFCLQCSLRPPADWSSFKYESLQTPESLFLFVLKLFGGFLNHFSRTSEY